MSSIFLPCPVTAVLSRRHLTFVVTEISSRGCCSPLPRCYRYSFFFHFVAPTGTHKDIFDLGIFSFARTIQQISWSHRFRDPFAGDTRRRGRPDGVIDAVANWCPPDTREFIVLAVSQVHGGGDRFPLPLARRGHPRGVFLHTGNPGKWSKGRGANKNSCLQGENLVYARIYNNTRKQTVDVFSGIVTCCTHTIESLVGHRFPPNPSSRRPGVLCKMPAGHATRTCLIRRARYRNAPIIEAFSVGRISRGDC